MGSVSGLTAFSLVFLSLAMMVFWQVTDIGGNQVIEEELLKFQTKEVASDIELVADYQNEGFAQISLPSQYSFGISSAPASSAAHHRLTMGLNNSGIEQTVNLNVRLEVQNRPGNAMANFSAETLCIYDDFHPRHAAGVLGFVNYKDIYDPEDSNPRDGSVEPDDVYVQIYPGECLP